jgi:hypothetical protein
MRFPKGFKMKLNIIDNTDETLVKEAASKIGLNLIDYTKLYNLYKIGAKVKSSIGYPDEMLALDRGYYEIAAGLDTNKKDILCVLNGKSFLGWFKTSPVVSCTVIDNGYKIETMNSHYELRLYK